MPLNIRKFEFGSVVGLGVFFLVLLLFGSSTRVLAQVTPPSPVPLPVPFNPIVDNAKVIDASSRDRLEAIFQNLKRQQNIEFAVVTVPTTGDVDIFDYSLAVARGWGIGSKDGDQASFLLIAAIQDRKYYTQVSRHLEGDLPDGLVGQIQRERLVPAFRQGNYGKGLLDTVQAFVATLGEKRGFSVAGIDQKYAYREKPKKDDTKATTICCGIALILFVLFLVSLASRGGPGRGGGGGGGGLLNALFWSTVFSNSGGGRSWSDSGSGWGGGGFGGGGGGFGGGFGGGGDFGGGGAGGSW